jgi:hypothetical protein
MSGKELDLRSLRGPLERALSKYEDYHYNLVRFQEFPDFARTPDKPNYARTIIPVQICDRKVGDLYAIVFMPRDGTGDTKTFNLNQVIIPEGFRHEEKPERVIPRAKTGVVCEGYFPLFSIKRGGDVSMFTGSLDELTAEGSPLTVNHAWTLGLNHPQFRMAVDFGIRVNPQVYLTVGTYPVGRRFGDPHSIYYGVNAGNTVQVAGFLSIADKENPLVNFTNKWVMPQRISEDQNR